VGFICYFNSLSNPFIWDDIGLIVRNPVIKHPANLAYLFSHGLFDPVLSDINVYRPLQAVSFLCDYLFFGLKANGFHLTNIVLHILNTLLLFSIFKKITTDFKIPFIASLLFIAHPIHTQAVTYISGRADLLMTFFILASLWFYNRSQVNLKSFSFYFSLILYIFSLLSKEAAIIFPLVLFTYHFFFLKEVSKKPLWLFFIVSLFYIFLRLSVLSFSQTNLFESQVSLGVRLLTFTKAFWVYIGLLFLPLNLHMERTLSVSKSIFELPTLVSLLGLLLIIVLIKTQLKNKLLIFSSLWFFIFLLPVSGFIPLNAILAEHWLYLSSFGFFVISAFFLIRLYERKKELAILLLTSLVLFYAVLTIKRNTAWKNPETFYKKILIYNPHSFKAQNNLAVLYYERKKFDKAIEGFKKVLKIKPGDSSALHNLGMTYASLGKNDLAKEYYLKAIKANPKDASTFYNLANLYREEGEFEKALIFYKKSIEVNPRYYFAYNNLANMYGEQGYSQKAIEFYQKAIKFNPHYATAYNNLGNIYVKLNELDKAESVYKRALNLRENFVDAHFNLGVVYYKKQDYQAALNEWRRVLELDPTHQIARENIRKVIRLEK
jgi:tetratricopeptide (TPR) repeat protein